MSELSINDFKALLLDLYLAQREIARLHERLAAYEGLVGAPEEQEGE